MKVFVMINKAVRSANVYLSLFGLKGLFKRAAVALLGQHNEFKASIPCSTRKIIVRLGTTDVAAFEHVFVNREYGFSLAQAPSIIVDAGANVGMSAAYFTLKYPHAKIFAIEPEPSNFSILKKNAELFPRIVPINAALWSHEGIVHINDSGGGHWGMRANQEKLPTSRAVHATTMRLLMKECRIQRIDLLKIDVEGAECEILQDASSWINCVGVICVELHDRFRPGCLDVYKAATVDFPIKWRRGELNCAAREGLIAEQ